MAIFQAAARRGGSHFAHGGVISRSFGITKHRFFFLALHEMALRRRHEKTMNSLLPLEFKGRMLSLTRVRVRDFNLPAIESQLRDFARQMPQAVQGMPVILEADEAFDLGGLLACLKDVGMQPLAAVDGPLTGPARNWGLPVVPVETGTAKPARAPAAAAPAATAAPAPRRSTRIIDEPVRSGQQIYAVDSDLILTNTVSAGAEVIADGCIHVYGSLRGRAIAGGKGDVTARIFCRRFEAELIAVAGVYAVSEQTQGDLRGKPVTAGLLDGKLKIDRLDW